MYGNYVSFLFVIVTYFLFCHTYAIYVFDIITVFDDVRITLYFGTFELRTEITLQLPFVFVRYSNIFFLTSQLRYLFVRCSYVFDDVRITLYFGTFELHTEITL